jgi:hypothetical protein
VLRRAPGLLNATPEGHCDYEGMVKAHKHSIAMMAYAHASFITYWAQSAGLHCFHECK